MKIEFTEQEMPILAKALYCLPYGEVAKLIENIQAQIKTQTTEDNGTSEETE